MADRDHNESWFSRRTDNYDDNMRIMLTAIVSSLFLIVIFVLILHVYARCFLRRQERRRPISTAAVHTVQPPKTGLDPSIVASLPLYMFKKQTSIGSSDFMECSVCLSTLEDGEMARTLPNCKHTFHSGCIDTWFGSNSTCPICRTEAQPRMVAEQREGVVGPSPSAPAMEGTSDGSKIGGSSSRFSSFRRILSREKSSTRIQIQTCGEEHGLSADLERQ